MGPTSKGVFIGIVLVLLVAVAAWITVVYTGAYNVAATEPHGDAVRWTLDTNLHRSVARRAENVRLPENLTDDMVARGARHYAESCAHCHGGPGKEPAKWSRGMRPEPPHLTEAATHWRPAEIYWIVQNGLKMTGMPAFGPHHPPEEIAAIAAFVSKLPGLSPEDYRKVTEGAGAGGQGGGGGTPPTPAPDQGEAPAPESTPAPEQGEAPAPQN